MNISIPNYEILNFESEALVISDVGITKVYSQPLLKALQRIRRSGVMTKIELDGVLSEHGLNVQDAFGFLEKIVPLKAVEQHYFTETIVVHEWKGSIDFERVLRQELTGELEFMNFSFDDLVKRVHGLPCFVVLVCHAYDYEKVKKLYFALAAASPQSAISVCWPMGNIFCIGQPYIAEVGNPCHFCTVDRLLSSESFLSEKLSWARVLNFCKGKHVSVPCKALSLYQELLVVGAIARVVKFFIGHGDSRKYQDNVLYATYLQLSDGKIYEESISHWYMCDCLGVGYEKRPA